ncbi:MAG TPA: GNAT family N-acetyltransferase [Gaiellaceae bacterium]|nr:GNAT family N-acetyltransferase [Gaiellaceae bacterium]
MIRPARPEEASAVAAITLRAYAHYVERIGRRPAPMDADYDELVAAGRVFVSVVDGEVAGAIVLARYDDHLLVENVAVDPRFQKRGLGRALLAFAEDEARAQGIGILRLYTNVLMVENIALYTRLGWRETERRSERDFARVFFEKRLE